MSLSRRKLLRLAAGAVSLSASSRDAWSQAYPNRPVRLIVGFPPGGNADLMTRLIGQWLSERLGQPFVVENRPGAGTNLATEAVVRALPDGYTLLVATDANAINATFYKNLNFNFIRDIVPVAGIVRTPSVLLVHPSFPASTVPELIAYAKAHPGKINMGSGGIGIALHLQGEMFKMMAGIDMVHVPYRGGAPALADLLAGAVQVLFVPVGGAIDHIRAGKLRALAVTTAVRAHALPDVPAMADFLPGYESSVWGGIGAPKGTSAEIVDKLNREINAGLADPKIKARFADLGSIVLPGSPTDFSRLIVEETEKLAKVVAFSGATAD